MVFVIKKYALLGVLTSPFTHRSYVEKCAHGAAFQALVEAVQAWHVPLGLVVHPSTVVVALGTDEC